MDSEVGDDLKPKKKRKYKESEPWDEFWYKHYPREKIDNWKEWHYANLDVWNMFWDIAQKMYRDGRRHYSAYTIFYAIRFKRDLETTKGEFKINNIHIPMFVRLLIGKDRKFFGFFKLRPIGDEVARALKKRREKEEEDF